MPALPHNIIDPRPTKPTSEDKENTTVKDTSASRPSWSLFGLMMRLLISLNDIRSGKQAKK